MRAAGLSRLIVIAVMASVWTVASSSSALAGTDVVDGVCHSNEICHFEDVQFGGRVADWNSCEPNWACGVSDFLQWEYYGTSTNVNDKIDSIKNRITATGSSTWAMVAEHQFGGGTIVCYPKGSSYSYTGAITNVDTSMWKSYNYC
jgi:hypothetical protein